MRARPLDDARVWRPESCAIAVESLNAQHMANTLHFRRELCAAVEPIGFEPQFDVYIQHDEQSSSSALTLEKITTANVAIVDGVLVADFHLNDDAFAQPEEIVVTALIANGPTVGDMSPSTAVKLRAMVLGRRWPLPAN